MPKRIDYTGVRFGQLVGIRQAGFRKWLWRCDCGNETIAMDQNVKRGNTTSCGCVKSERWAQLVTKHGLSKSGSAAYKAWERIRKRCSAKSGSEYRDYASKGIRLCDEWARNPVAFVDYVGEPPQDGMSIDRIDNSKGYEPGNVRWATPVEQANNKTNNRFVEYRGETMTLSEMIRRRAADEGVSERVMRGRVERRLYRGEQKPGA